MCVCVFVYIYNIHANIYWSLLINGVQMSHNKYASSGIVALDIRLLCISVYTLRARKSAPQALCLAGVLLGFRSLPTVSIVAPCLDLTHFYWDPTKSPHKRKYNGD